MIGGLAMCLRAEARSRWKVWVAIALMLGVLAGGAITAAAGARRTHSAYPRFLERYGVYDLNVATAGHEDTEEIYAEIIREIPQVEATRRSALFFGSVRLASGREVSFPDVFLVADQGLETGPSLNEVKVLEGRAADPADPAQAVATHATAERFDLRTGDRIEVRIGGPDGSLSEPMPMRIVGVVAVAGTFETLTGAGFPQAIAFTPAFWRAHAGSSPESDLSVRLKRRAADIPKFNAEVAARDLPLDGPPSPVSRYTEGVQALNRVPAVALWGLAGLLAIASVALIGQALAREALNAAPNLGVYRALGMSRRARVAMGMLRAFVIAVPGVMLAIGTAILASPLTPVGLARVAEPDPGVRIDAVALAAGGTATLILVALAALWPSLRSAGADADPAEEAQRSRLAGAIARTPVPPSVLSGVRLALEPGRGRRAVPIRTAVLGALLVVGAVNAVTVFDSSLQRLLEDPALSGYRWDAVAVPPELSEGQTPAEAVEELSQAVPEDLVTQKWKGTVFPLVQVDGLEITAHAGERQMASIIQGRAPARPNEVALDPTTLEQIGASIGERVRIGGERTTEFMIVGTFVPPRLAFQGTLVGQGASFTPDGLGSVTSFDYEGVYMRFVNGIGLDDGADRLREALGDAAFVVLSPTQVAAARNLRRLSNVPTALTGVLGAVAIASLVHTLGSTVSRRRRDLAILKTLGFVRRQLRATVSWQCTILVGIALALGLPIGIASGRWMWRLFANEITVVPLPVTSADMLAMIPIGLLLANAIAFFFARAAARTQAAVVLRAE